MAVTFANAAELVQKLGNIPLAHLLHAAAGHGHRARPARRDAPLRPPLRTRRWHPRGEGHGT